MADTEIFEHLSTGLVVLSGGEPVRINQAARQLLQIRDDDNSLGPYEESLRDLLATGEDGYAKQLTGVPGKPLSAILHVPTSAQTFVELSESFETRLGEASHELRRPLSNIKTLVDTLYLWGAAEDPATRNRFLGQLHQEVARILQMVNDLLDLSRIQAGIIPLNVQRISLCTLIEDTFSLVAEQAREMEVSLDNRVPTDFVLVGDLDKLNHVVQNLIENAIRYNSHGGSVVVEVVGSNGFSISDTGSGIPEEHRKAVFERFRRVNKKIPGTGLGLAIVKSIVDLHGGAVELDSEEGKGSKFTITLPERKLVSLPLG